MARKRRSSDEERRSGSRPARQAEGARRATGACGAGRNGGGGPLQRGQRWTATRKQEVVLRMFRGEPLDSLSRELGVEIYRLEEWRDRALAGIHAVLKSRGGDPLEAELAAAMKRIGEPSMENELLQIRCRKGNIRFPTGRSRT